MKISGHRNFPVRRERIWNALYDRSVLEQCIPGCESVVGSPHDGHVDIVVLRKVGPIKARFRGTVELREAHEHECITLVATASGKTAGFARGVAKINLTKSDEGTSLQYDAEIHVGGKIAQIGSRLFRGVARKFTEQCMENLHAHFLQETN